MSKDFVFDIGFGANCEPNKVEHAEWSMEAMQEEIAEGTSLTDHFAMEAAATGLKATCEAELSVINMACYEAQGKEGDAAVEIFNKYGLTSEFAMEAAKDVIARQAFMGSAKIKALIATAIKYIQEMITFSSVSNKGFKAVEKMAKKQAESLKKKQGSAKVSKDTFVRSIIDAPAFFNKATSKKSAKVLDALSNVKEFSGSNDIEDIKIIALSLIEGLDVSISGDITKPMAEKIKEGKDAILEELKSETDEAKDKEEFEKTALITKTIENLNTISNIAKGFAKDKTIKNLDKIKAKLSKLTNEATIKKNFKSSNTNSEGLNAGEFQTVAQNLISGVTAFTVVYKTTNKNMLSIMDTILTDAKAVEAMAV